MGDRSSLAELTVKLAALNGIANPNMIVAGTVTYKMAPHVRRIYDQMAAPKWVIAMGDCASCGGVFNNYAIYQGVDEVVPVDVFVAGCPPRPEALIHGVLTLHDKVNAMKLVEKPAEAK